MSVPEHIYASPDPDDGWRWPRASKLPEQGPRVNVCYIRADLHQSALRSAREAALREAAEVAATMGALATAASILALIPKDGEKP